MSILKYTWILSFFAVLSGCHNNQARKVANDPYDRKSVASIKIVNEETRAIMSTLQTGKVSPKLVDSRETQANAIVVDKLMSLDLKGKSEAERRLIINEVQAEAERAKKKMRDSLYKEPFSPNWK